MTQDEIEIKNDLLVKKYQDKIEMLVNVISKLESTKKDLDTTISNHQANGEEYQKKQTLLKEINKDIENKKIIQSQVTESTDALNLRKNELSKEIEKLEKLSSGKGEYVSDIEKLQNQIIVLQKEMETFQNSHTENKNIANIELSNIKQEIKDLHQKLGLLIN